MSNWVMVTKEEGEFLAHSSGPWKKHKYISKKGKTYIYSKMENGGRNKTGRDMSDATKEKLTGIKPRLNKDRIAKAASGELHKEQERKEVKDKMTVLKYGKLNKDHIRKAASGELHGRTSNVKTAEELRAEKKKKILKEDKKKYYSNQNFGRKYPEQRAERNEALSSTQQGKTREEAGKVKKVTKRVRVKRK